MKKEKLLALESMRGIAAISVAFFHFKVGSHFNNDFVANAWLMVDFFFVLSGFVIALNYIDKLKTPRDIINFQFKRFLRLYPLHFLMLVLFVGIEIAKYILEIKFGFVANNPPFSENNLKPFVANLLLIHNWTLSELTFNYPSWSISAEFVTYALFAFLILISKSNRILMSILLIISVIIFGALISETGMGTGNLSGGPFRCLYSFSIGALTFLIYRNCVNLNFSIHSIITLILIFLNIFTVSKYGSKDLNFIILFPLLFGITILSIALNNKQSYLNKILSTKWLVHLGTISYGIYMIHYFVWRVIFNICRFILKFPTTTNEEGKMTILIENIYIADIVTFIGISIIIISAHISFKYFESRFTSK